MGSLVEAVKDTAKRPLIIADCTEMINQEVKSKSGLTGIAVKGGFKAIRGFSPDIVPKALNDLIDEFAVQVEPFWQDCQIMEKTQRVTSFVGKRILQMLCCLSQMERPK